MPLDRSCNVDAVSNNIRDQFKKKEKPHKQSIAIALSVLRRSCGIKGKEKMTPKEMVRASKRESSDLHSIAEIVMGVHGVGTSPSASTVPVQKGGRYSVHVKPGSGLQSGDGRHKGKPKIDRKRHGGRYGMHYETIMNRLREQQKLDGEVEREEFNVAPAGVSMESRKSLEDFVYENTPCRHKFIKGGNRAMVYYDARGRATACELSKVPFDDLSRLGSNLGYQMSSPAGPAPSPSAGYVPTPQEGDGGSKGGEETALDQKLTEA